MSPTNVNGTLFFRANDGIFGWELWRSDGTTAGTALVGNGARERHPAETSLAVYPVTHLTGVGGTLFFFADNGHSGHELWAATP
jgi:ELWxxDGT repeat protein